MHDLWWTEFNLLSVTTYPEAGTFGYLGATTS